MKTSDVFELLRDGGPQTRAQLAQSSGLARSTIAARIDVLLRLGLVAPYGDAVSTGGRPPSVLAVNPRARVVVGVDLGATHARAVLADLAGTILAEAR
ncbi:MAG: winged helix-turn-helix transcriptional regulator, partial [Nocardioides sp.]|uniref:winged helix-turn-helix transcriptional regulator n=1 Tax=Nocardioides sp. TaxID=35761 RepID=UPI003264D13E